jgi:pyridoxamine 5'-phosphate oxidase
VSVEIEQSRNIFLDRRFDEADLLDDPFDQFDLWFREAEDAGLYQPEAMVVSTVDGSGAPSSRFVLLRGHDRRGFRFFTDFASAKAADLEDNPRVALLFPWNELWRQIRIAGTVTRVDDDEADEYWASRPRGSQVAAVASDQSSPIASRAALETRFDEVDREHEGRRVPRPATWGGFVVAPSSFEFWQGRENRFHDRLRFRSVGEGWVVERLQP